ncbi:MAG: prepilin-type N-terminal cleavage/methylation domain-containing protein, partial [Gammaproteobacteria bacterium]|nr:prepilin-type N-terminal cleavage/methylation domain-containing protein [Gammaproteobacteria bacterium]
MSRAFPTAAGGFTLIELMVVVIVVTILAIITIPAYERYTTRSKILAAQAALVSMGVDLKEFQQDHMTYAGGCPTPPPTPGPQCA